MTLQSCRFTGAPTGATTVDSAQVRFAHRLIESEGVDLVHGHSSHHPRPIEMYRGKLVLYRVRGHRRRLRRHLHVRVVSGTSCGCCTSRPVDGGRAAALAYGADADEKNAARARAAQDAAWLQASVTEMSRRFATRIDISTDGALTVGAR